MKKFIVHVAHDVPHYGKIEVTARDNDHAFEIIKTRKTEDILECAWDDPNWECSVNARIVFIVAQDGTSATHEDEPLTQQSRLNNAADGMRKALQEIDNLLRALLDGEHSGISRDAGKDLKEMQLIIARALPKGGAA